MQMQMQMTTLELNVPATFVAPEGQTFDAMLLTLYWGPEDMPEPVVLVLQMVGEQALAVEAAGLFHNPPAGRLRPPADGFDLRKPLFFQLALRPAERAAYHAWTANDYAAALRGDTPLAACLLNEAAWNALMVWQETQVAAALGGQAIKYGYKTKWTAPTSEVDRLRRRGRISAVMVEAFIENSWPVRLAEDNETLLLDLMVEGRAFRCYLIADDAESAASIVVEHPLVVPRARLVLVQALLAEMNANISPGFFEYAEQPAKVAYHCTLQAPPGLLPRAFIEGLVNVGITMMAHNAQVLAEAIAG